MANLGYTFPLMMGGIAAVREVGLSWRQARSNFFPDLTFWKEPGEPVVISGQSIFIPEDRVDVAEMKVWLDPVARSNYAIYGRFEIKQFDIRTDRRRHGLIFSFSDVRDAVMFSMRWL